MDLSGRAPIHEKRQKKDHSIDGKLRVKTREDEKDEGARRMQEKERTKCVLCLVKMTIKGEILIVYLEMRDTLVKGWENETRDEERRTMMMLMAKLLNGNEVRRQLPSRPNKQKAEDNYFEKSESGWRGVLPVPSLLRIVR